MAEFNLGCSSRRESYLFYQSDNQLPEGNSIRLPRPDVYRFVQCKRSGVNQGRGRGDVELESPSQVLRLPDAVELFQHNRIVGEGFRCLGDRQRPLEARLRRTPLALQPLD